MANGQILAIGLLLIILAVAGYITPMSVTLAETTVNLTIPKVVAFCDSGIGQFSQMLPQVVMVCSQFNTFMFGIYGAGLIGLGLLIGGAVMKQTKEELEAKYSRGELTKDEFENELKDRDSEEDNDSMEILKKRYAKGEISKEEFDKMKKDLENS